ncbi:MAG: sodium:glutamate symporter [Fretibacterium sp.]|nr:sodium:glutamate symporter [Fretibacterium sp.]
MNWENVDGVLTVSFDPLFTTALAALFYVIGVSLKRRLNFLSRFCFPAAVIGGLLMDLIVLVFHQHGGMMIKFAPTLQSPMMLAFFTTVGIGGSLRLLKKGGRALIVYLCVCWALAVFQNAFGAGLANALGIHPTLGVMAGAVSLGGGHAAAAAFGPMAEAVGVAGAHAVAVASATFGQIAGGILGGPLATWLINRHKGRISASRDDLYREQQGEGKKAELSDSFDLVKMLALVLILMALGSAASGWFNHQAKEVWNWKNFSLPDYLGAMFVAVIFRSFNDGLKLVRIHERAVGMIAGVSLGLFLTMATMTLRIWDLYDLTLPLISILVLQSLTILLIAAFLLFHLLGGDYEAAVMCSGFVGHSLGATSNAVSNMGAVCERYGVFSYKAFLIVPLCGAVLIDLVGIPNIVWFINFLAGK